MKIEELRAGADIILHVDIGGRKGDFPSLVIESVENGIIAEPVRINNKVLGFAVDNIKLSMTYITGETAPIFWRVVSCDTILRDGKTVYLIKSSIEGFEQNRREAFRVYVGVDGVAQVGINTKALDVIVKDISETGFSFVTEMELEKAINMPIRLVFRDAEMEMEFSLMGVVVRKVVIDEKKILYGCKISVDNPRLSTYINKKQRQQMSMHRDSGSYNVRPEVVKSLMESETENRNNKKSERPERKNVRMDGNRYLDEVDKEERRKVFRSMYSGKRV